MLKPLVKKISETEGYSEGNATFLNVEDAETISSNYIRIKKGEKTELGNHPDEEELYIVLGGRAAVELAGKSYEVGRGSVIYIPRSTDHQSTCISDEDYEFICVANWPDKIPDEASN